MNSDLLDNITVTYKQISESFYKNGRGTGKYLSVYLRKILKQGISVALLVIKKES